MIKYPKSECEAHLNVKTDKPVCIICMGNEIEQLKNENAAYEMTMQAAQIIVDELKAEKATARIEVMKEAAGIVMSCYWHGKCLGVTQSNFQRIADSIMEVAESV